MSVEKTNDAVRNYYMDFLKGISILAVIIGHSITDIHRYDLLFNFIYSFHMPLLFFVSAYIEQMNRHKYETAMKKMPLKRLKSLILPYFCWSLLYMLFYGQLFGADIERIIRILFGYEQSGLWFLPVLFGLKFFHFLYWKLQNWLGKHSLIKDFGICILLEVLIVIFAFSTAQPYIINLVSYSIPYFFAVIFVDNEILQKILKKKLTVIGAVIAYMLVFPLFSFYNTHWTTQIIRIFLSLCISILCLGWKKVWKYTFVSKVICFFGRYSLAIYVMHVFFMGYKRYLELIEPLVMALLIIVFMAVVVAIICILIARIIEKTVWLNRLLFGK